MPGFFTPVIKEEFGIADDFHKQVTKEFADEMLKFKSLSDDQLELVDKAYRERIHQLTNQVVEANKIASAA